MIDFIQSPLQFVRKMTDTEWQDLKLRQAQREARKRQQRLQSKASREQQTSQRITETRTTRAADSRATFRESSRPAN